MEKKYVWYVVYGSNMQKERFMKYIEGGFYEVNGKTYKGCADKSPPLKDKPYLIPYELYFGNKSKTWGGGGVAFIDGSKAGVTLGCAYLITEDQFIEIREQEGSSDKWYGHTVTLAHSYGDFIYVTITQTQENREDNPANDNYLKIMHKGLCETYPQLEQFAQFKIPIFCQFGTTDRRFRRGCARPYALF